MDMVHITDLITDTGLTDITDIGRIVYTDTSLTDISVGAAAITGVVTAEDMGGEEYMVEVVGMDGEAVAMAGQGMVDIEMKLCTNIAYFNLAEMDG